MAKDDDDKSAKQRKQDYIGELQRRFGVRHLPGLLRKTDVSDVNMFTGKSVAEIAGITDPELYLKHARDNGFDWEAIEFILSQHAEKEEGSGNALEAFQKITSGGSHDNMFSNYPLLLTMFVMMGNWPIRKTVSEEVWRTKFGADIKIHFMKDGSLDSARTAASFLAINNGARRGLASMAFDPQIKAEREKFLGEVDKQIAQSTPADIVVGRTDNNVSIYNVDYPEMRYSFQLSSSVGASAVPALLRSEYKNLNTALERYKATAQEMEATLGITRTVEGSKVSYSVPGLNDSLVVNFDEAPLNTENASVKLSALRNRLRTDEGKYLKDAYDLRKQGFTVNFQDGKDGTPELVVSHPDPQWVTLEAKLAGPAALIGKEARELIKMAKASKLVPHVPPTPPAPPEVPEPEAAAAPVIKVRPAIEDKDKVDIVFDSAALMFLSAAARTRNRSWIDLVSLITALPNVNRVIIPSIVADWEFRGKIPAMDSRNVHSLVTIDEKMAKDPAFKERDAFLKQATRSAIAQDGTRVTIPGENSKIVIWESEKQHALYQNLSELVRTCKEKGHSVPGKLTQFRESEGANQGELAALDYCNSKDCTHPATIVTHDIVFSKNLHLNAKRTRNKKMNTQTSNGRGINTQTTEGFLQAMDEGFEGQLATLVNIAFGGEEKNTKPERIIINHNRTALPDRQLYQDIYFSDVQGRAANGTKETTLKDSIALGAGYMLDDFKTLGPNALKLAIKRGVAVSAAVGRV